MALENHKIYTPDNVKQTTTATSTSAAATSTETTTQKPVPVAEKRENNPVFEKLASEEFQNLSDEEKLNKLKKLFPNISEEELQKTLAGYKTFETDSKKEVTPDDNDTNDAKISEQEKALNDYAKEHQIKDIDELIATIKSKNPEELSDNEKLILAYIYSKDNDASNNSVDLKAKVADILQKYGDEIDNLIPKETKKSKEWQEKTPSERLDAKTDALLEKIIPNYDTLSDDDKIKARDKFYSKLIDEFVPKELFDTSNAADMRIAKGALAVMADVADNSGKSLKEVLSGDKTDNQKNLADALTQVALDNADIDVKSKEWKQLTPDKQLDAIMDSSIKSLFPEYANDKEVQAKMGKIKGLVKEQFGAAIYGDEWKNFSANEKEYKMQSMVTKFSAMKNALMSVKEWNKADACTKLHHIEVYEQTTGVKLTPSEKIRRETAKKLNKENVTDADIKNHLINKSKTQELNDIEKIELETINRLEKKHEIDPEKSVRKDATEYLDYRVKNIYKGDWNTFVNKEILKGQSLEEFKKTHSEDELKELVALAGRDYISQTKLCEALGLDTQKYMDNYARTYHESYERLLVEGKITGRNNVNEINSIEATAHRHGRHDLVTASIDEFTEYNSDNAKLIGQHNIGLSKIDEQYVPIAAQKVNEYCSKEVALETGRIFNTSNEVSDSAKSSYTFTAVKTASAEMQAAYAQEFSQIKNSAVTEGLAAAEKYVDSGIKNQYSKYVDNAIKNNSYTPEQRSSIEQARTTGQTSYERTATTSSTSSTSSSSNTPDSVQAKQTNTTNSVSSSTAEEVKSIQVKHEQAKAELRTIRLQNELSKSVIELQKAIYQNDVAKKEQAMQKCIDVIEQIQSDSAAREVKKAERAQTIEDAAKVAAQAKTEEGVEAAAKRLEEIKEEQEVVTQVVDELVETATNEEQSKISSILDKETIQELKSAGSAVKAYEILAKKNSDIARLFIQILSRKGTTTILSFIRNCHDMSAIRMLILANPSLIKYLPKDMLSKIDLAKADAKELTNILLDLMQGGQRFKPILLTICEALGIKPGSDEWQQMNFASMSRDEAYLGTDASSQVPNRYYDRKKNNIRLIG